VVRREACSDRWVTGNGGARLEAGIGAPSSCAAREIDRGRRGSRAGLGRGALPRPVREDGGGAGWTGAGSASLGVADFH
jgi:hypothetical protein